MSSLFFLSRPSLPPLLLQPRLPGQSCPMRVRSMVGLIPLFASLVLEDEVIQKLPGFRKRLQWFLTNRKDLAKQVNRTGALVDLFSNSLVSLSPSSLPPSLHPYLPT